MNACIDEWVRRGYRNTMPHYAAPAHVTLPPWLGDERLHASHRANLLRKSAGYYRRFGWTESPDMPYYWPPESTSLLAAAPE
jgi:hypothetical protein